jgi:hypothetical protein
MVLDISSSAVFDAIIKILPLPNMMYVDFIIRLACVGFLKDFIISGLLPEEDQP